jgi:hypothetical protein
MVQDKSTLWFIITEVSRGIILLKTWTGTQLDVRQTCHFIFHGIPKGPCCTNLLHIWTTKASTLALSSTFTSGWRAAEIFFHSSTSCFRWEKPAEIHKHCEGLTVKVDFSLKRNALLKK